MEYILQYNDKEYTLPSYTIGTIEKIDNQNMMNFKQVNAVTKLKEMYKTVEFFLGKDNTKELLGTVNNMDINDLNIVWLEIVKVYNQPLEKYNSEEAESKLDTEVLDKISALAESIEKITSLQATK